MKPRITYSGSAFLLILSGCLFGDPNCVRIVSLKVPVPAGKNNVHISATDSEVQEALKSIDAAITSAGLTRAPNPGAPNSDGSLVFYEGTPGCSVSLQEDTLQIVFFVRGRWNATEAVKTTSDGIGQQLRRRYGAQSVRVETRH